MKLTVEFYSGLALRLSKEKAASIEVGDNATLRDVSAALAQKFPAFLGALIVPETYELVSPHLFNIHGQAVASLDTKPEEGERILLLSVTAGG